MAERKRRFGRRETLNVEQITSGLKSIGFHERNRKESGPFDRLVRWDNVAMSELQIDDDRSQRDSGTIYDRSRRNSGQMVEKFRRNSCQIFGISRKTSDSIFHKKFRKDSSTTFERTRRESGSFLDRVRKESSSFLDRMRRDSGFIFGRSRRESAPSFEKSLKDSIEHAGTKKKTKSRKISSIISNKCHDKKGKENQKRKYSVPEQHKIQPNVYPASWDEFMVISKGRSSAMSKWSGGDDASDRSSTGFPETPEPSHGGPESLYIQAPNFGPPHIELPQIGFPTSPLMQLGHTDDPDLGIAQTEHAQFGPYSPASHCEFDNNAERCTFQPLYCWCTRCQMMHQRPPGSDNKNGVWGNYFCFRF